MRVLSAFLLALVLSACSTSPGRPQVTQSALKADLDVDNMYVRGVFNWWGASEAFRFSPSSQDNLWTMQAELIADGQAYDFKLSDKNWSPTQNCGSIEANTTVIGLNQSAGLYCAADASNFQFTPQRDGVYLFEITRPSAGFYFLTISFKG